jgi:hypothetical protein
MEYGVDIFDQNGVKMVGFDNPTTIIDDVARQINVVSYDPPLVNGLTVTFSNSLSKTYPQRSGVVRLVCIPYYDNFSSQINAAPYCMGWLVLEVG